MIDYTDVGCWIVKGDPNTSDYFRWLDENDTPPEKPHVYVSSWTLGDTNRTQMMCPVDLIALCITGCQNPGIYDFGWVTSETRYWGDGFGAADRPACPEGTTPQLTGCLNQVEAFGEPAWEVW